MRLFSKSLFVVCSLILSLFYSCTTAPTNDLVNATGQVSEIDSAYVASKTKYFTVKNGIIEGEGQLMWNSIISSSQFVMFGERHGSVSTGTLTEALIPMLAGEGFGAFAMEVGPHSAKVLERLTTIPEQTFENLKAINSKYYDSELESDPIPFYSGIEDARFLQKAAETKMEFWGLDQEYYYAPLLLMDELLMTAKGQVDYDQLKLLKDQVDGVLLKWYQEEINNDEVEIFEEFAKDNTINAFFKAFGNNQLAKSIIEDLQISWDIYTRWRSGSHADRVSYMRNNFMDHYDRRSKEQSNPKVFLKFGQVHAAQNVSLGTYDLGHLVNELAKKNGTISTNINSWTRYYEEDGLVEDYYKSNPSWFRRIEDFICQGKKDEWAIINLTEIRSDVSAGDIVFPKDGSMHKIKTLIEGYDYQLILPLDRYITPNVN